MPFLNTELISAAHKKLFHISILGPNAELLGIVAWISDLCGKCKFGSWSFDGVIRRADIKPRWQRNISIRFNLFFTFQRRLCDSSVGGGIGSEVVDSYRKTKSGVAHQVRKTKVDGPRLISQVDIFLHNVLDRNSITE